MEYPKQMQGMLSNIGTDLYHNMSSWFTEILYRSANYLLKIVSPEKVATSTYVNPIVALFLGWYFLGEQITMQSIMAAVVLLTGVYFINTKKKLAIFSRFRR